MTKLNVLVSQANEREPWERYVKYHKQEVVIIRSINSNYLDIAREEAIEVNSYAKLLENVAKLAYTNANHILYFRGQSDDFRNQNDASSLYPSIYRGRLEKDELLERFRLLEESSKELIKVAKEYGLSGFAELKRKKYVQWSILQHYEVCDTPFLDITHSLSVACTFATMQGNDYGYIYVLAMPYQTNRITINSEEDMVLVRLLSISPPDAKRPYYQEGYVCATTDITYDYDRKDELDFNSRLVAKFKFRNTKRFWGESFSKISNDFLYPEHDKFCDIAREVMIERKRGFYSENIGEFLLLWNEFEELLREYSPPRAYFNTSKALKNFFHSNDTLDYNLQELEQIRKTRNQVVHNIKNVEPEEVDKQFKILKGILEQYRL